MSLQSIFSKPGHTYRIVSDIDLNESTINIPKNCILDFQGGSITNGIIACNNTIIKNFTKSSNVTITGTYYVTLTPNGTSSDFVKGDGSLDNTSYVISVEGKQLSTEDFTSALKSKLESLSNYNDTELNNKVDQLTNNFNTLVNENPTQAIENFNEIIAFLNNIEDDTTLEGIIAGIELQIADIKSDIDINKEGLITAQGEIITLIEKTAGIPSQLALRPTYDEVYVKEEGGDSSQFLKGDGSIDSTDYLPSSSYTPSDILDKLKTVDGPESGLDADTVDSLQASSFARDFNTTTEDVDNLTKAGTYRLSVNNPNTPIKSNYGNLLVVRGQDNDTITQLYFPYDPCSVYIRSGNFTEGSINYYKSADWKKVAFTDSNVAGINYTQLTDEDLNDLKSYNFKYYSASGNNTCTNKPSGVNAFQLFLYGVPNTSNYFVQSLIDTYTGNEYKRRFKDGSWSDWKKMLDENNIDNFISSALQSFNERLTELESKVN